MADLLRGPEGRPFEYYWVTDQGEFATDVMLRILQLDTVSKSTLDQVEENLRTNFIANLSQVSRRDAHDLLAEIFNSFDRQHETKFMDSCCCTTLNGLVTVSPFLRFAKYE